MNHIDNVRLEMLQYFNPDNFLDHCEETFFSPNNKYGAETKSFREGKPGFNLDVTKVAVYKNDDSNPLFSFMVNEETFFHSWITKGNVDYLLFAEDLCGVAVADFK